MCKPERYSNSHVHQHQTTMITHTYLHWNFRKNSFMDKIRSSNVNFQWTSAMCHDQHPIIAKLFIFWTPTKAFCLNLSKNINKSSRKWKVWIGANNQSNRIFSFMELVIECYTTKYTIHTKSQNPNLADT